MRICLIILKKHTDEIYYQIPIYKVQIYSLPSISFNISNHHKLIKTDMVIRWTKWISSIHTNDETDIFTKLSRNIETSKKAIIL